MVLAVLVANTNIWEHVQEHLCCCQLRVAYCVLFMAKWCFVALIMAQLYHLPGLEIMHCIDDWHFVTLKFLRMVLEVVQSTSPTSHSASDFAALGRCFSERTMVKLGLCTIVYVYPCRIHIIHSSSLSKPSMSIPWTLPSSSSSATSSDSSTISFDSLGSGGSAFLHFSLAQSGFWPSLFAASCSIS